MYVSLYDQEVNETLYSREYAENDKVLFKVIKDFEGVIITNFLR